MIVLSYSNANLGFFALSLSSRKLFRFLVSSSLQGKVSREVAVINSSSFSLSESYPSILP
jgi:hypothetical protein